MSRLTHLSGVQVGTEDLVFGQAYLTASLPAAADNAYRLAVITDNGVGDNEIAVVFSNGTAWTLLTGAALT